MYVGLCMYVCMYVCINISMYSVSQKIPPPPEIFWDFFPKGWEFLVKILHAY